MREVKERASKDVANEFKDGELAGDAKRTVGAYYQKRLKYWAEKLKITKQIL